MKAILQKAIPGDLTPLINAPLPGTRPVAADHWLVLDDAYDGQMALRDSLLAKQHDDVLRMDESARPAAEELAQMVMGWALEQPGFRAGDGGIWRPDGVFVPQSPADPLGFAGRLVQEDLCILQRVADQPGDPHVLTGAVLCFPAAWTLAEKFMKPLIGLHRTVTRYDENVARRVQRLFDGLQPGRPLMRVNGGLYETSGLYAPRREDDPRPKAGTDAPFARSERQCLIRLPRTRAVVFTIHTYVVKTGVLDADQRARLNAD